MKHWTLIGLSGALLTCAQCSERQFGRSELVGAWLMMSEGVDYPADCRSPFLPIQYHPNGTYSMIDERGNWRLEGDVLTETATSHDPPMENEETEVEIGKLYVSSLRWNGRDRFWKRFANGNLYEFVRCATEK